ncbi:TRAP transporter large permease [Palleronia sp. LCG004]|uniref:TRAP transporter large permease n=1 Tax=Palleronia sp. LCG004 TaxID=3079304 RepID=UPI0029430356|nr:TRAP transporter large permease [Palleronia sp. LCG004]WOI57833.1 TRAP transporter large permease [Palleronia sp. LCG004]
MELLLILGGMAVLLVLRVPVAFAMLLPSLAYIGMSPRISMGVGVQRVTALLDSFPLLAVPLFIFVGFLANAAGLADKLIKALLVLTGKVRGSLAYVNVNASLVFSWMSGSALADSAALGSVLVPTMRKNGYDPNFAAAITAASSTMGPIMPPSIAAVLYAVLTGASVAATFFAGVVPALLIFVALTVYIYVYARNRTELKVEPIPREEAVRTLLGALPIFFAPVILLGGILGGIFTPTEAAAATAMYLLILSFVCRWLTLRGLYQTLAQTAATTGRVMIIASVGALFAYILAREQIPQQAAGFLISLTENPILFLLLLNIFLLLVGMVLEPASALLVTVPIFYPIAQEYGIDPIHLGVVVIFNLTLGLMTPPVCLVLHMLAQVGNLNFGGVLRATVPLLVILFGVLLVVTYVPALTLTLPRLLGF